MHPEQVNHGKPPYKYLEEAYRTGNKGKSYVKPRDAAKILSGNDLRVAADACPELKAFLNTILQLCGGEKI
ncbi:hypothetical protein AGMMS50289_23480 [Betaproteobacteria bacterium]|nr:hypothetical protein AGMMS50289_23480 [Betaproteobacteria bacterium]